MEFDTRLRRFISGKKITLFMILQCAIGLFNHRQTAMFRGRRSALRTTKYAMYRQNDWPIIIRLKYCNGPRKRKNHWKDHASIASQTFSPSLSKRFFRLPLPSIPMSSINSHPDGTPVNNRGQALEAQRLYQLSLSGRDYSRRYIGFARSNCLDAQRIVWEARCNLLKDIKVPGQTRLERKDMAAKLDS